MRKQLKKVVALTMAAAMMAGMVGVQSTSAAKAPKMAKSNYSVKRGKTVKVAVKNSDKKAKVTWKSSKPSVARITKKVTKGAKASATVKGIKGGTAKITAVYKFKKMKKKLSTKVKVVGDKKVVNPVNNTQIPAGPAVAAPTNAPVNQTQAPVQTVQPTQAATAEPIPTPTPTPQLLTANTTKLVDTPKDYKDKKDDVEYGTVEKFRYYSDITDSDREAIVALPPNYDDTKSYPVVYVMHGIGCTKEMFGTSVDGSSIARMIANAMAAGTCEEMIAVFPGIRVSNEPEDNMHSNENYKHYDDFREDLINNLMPAMAEEYSVKSGRENTAVCGWSMGGREALYIGLSKPELFGYVAGFCPAFGLLPYNNPDVKKSEDGLLTVEGTDGDVITLPEEYINNTYVQISAGTYDSVVHDEPMRYRDALKKGNVPTLFNEYPSGHSEGVWEPGFYNLMINAFKTVE